MPPTRVPRCSAGLDVRVPEVVLHRLLGEEERLDRPLQLEHEAVGGLAPDSRDPGQPGSVAAPTAGLHFTPELLARLDARGVERAELVLHVGPGTFRPIRCERLAEHRLEAERFCVPEASASAIAETRAAGGRVIAVGTTVVRALETTGGAAGAGDTALLVLPGHEFRAVDSLITNFHLPGSSLLALVMAFAGIDATLELYGLAIRERYRFYSFGDAMLVL